MIHAINGQEFYGIQAQWESVAIGYNTDGTRRLSDWARLAWTTSIMTRADYIRLLTLEGAQITELKTTNYQTRATQGTYTNAQMTIINGSFNGNRVDNVTVNFRVKV